MKIFKRFGLAIFAFCCLAIVSAGILLFCNDSYNAGKASVTPKLEQTTNEFTLKVQQLQLDIAEKQEENAQLQSHRYTLITQRDEAIAYGELSDAEIAELNTQIDVLNSTIEENTTMINTLSSRSTRLASIIDRTVTEVYAEDLEGMTKIGSYAFAKCISLKSIELPNTITSIGSYAFYECSGLVSIAIPDSVTSIGTRTFSYCYSLVSVDWSDNPIKIGERAFSSCVELASIDLPNTLDLTKAFEMFNGCTGLTNVNIANGISTIPYNMFRNCSSLTSITIPNSVTFMGASAFNNCSKLSEVVFEDGINITQFASGLFNSCSSLISIVIPASVTEISSSVFQYCTNLTDITILSPEPPTLSNTNAIPSSATLHVYGVDTYKSATNWSSLTNEFVEIETTEG